MLQTLQKGSRLKGTMTKRHVQNQTPNKARDT